MLGKHVTSFSKLPNELLISFNDGSLYKKILNKDSNEIMDYYGDWDSILGKPIFAWLEEEHKLDINYRAYMELRRLRI
jgi:hypothetical protein